MGSPRKTFLGRWPGLCSLLPPGWSLPRPDPARPPALPVSACCSRCLGDGEEIPPRYSGAAEGFH